MQLIIPAFNEERRLPDTLRALRAYVLAATDGVGPVDVIVVDNASTDRTAEVARSFDSPAMPVRVIHCADARQGCRGPRRGRGERPATGSPSWTPTAPRDLDALVDGDRLLDGGVDVAIGVAGADRLGHLGAAQPAP